MGAVPVSNICMAPLVRSSVPDDAQVDDLRTLAADLTTRLNTRAAEVARAKADLGAFKNIYRQRVGLLHEELEELESTIAELELDELTRQRGSAEPGPRKAPAGAAADAPARYTSDGVRRLFRDVAKAIHPDLARDADARDRRHALMIEANRAYVMGDEERLRRILQAWEQSPEAVIGDDPDSLRLRLARRVAQLEEQLLAFDGELAALQDTPSWKLKTMVDEAATKGKDLMRDTVIRLKRDIMVARNRLDAIRSQP